MFLPLIAFSHEQEAIVQAVLTIQPKLDALCVQAKTVPVRGAGNLSRMLLGEDLDSIFQVLTAYENTTLRRNGCADLTGS